VFGTAGYGHIAPKTSWGQVVTIIYAIFGIPLTLFTITNLGGFMATAFRFIYRNICCTLCCVCCRRPQPTADDDDLETGTGNRNPPDADEVKPVSRWTSLRRSLTNTEDIRGVHVSVFFQFRNLFLFLSELLAAAPSENGCTILRGVVLVAVLLLVVVRRLRFC